MNTLDAFRMGDLNRGREMRVFDWHKARRLVQGAKEAIAGLRGDMEYTSGVIYKDGKEVHDDSTYLASTWAIPVVVVDGVEFECYVMNSEQPEWDAKTKWPK